MPKIPGIIGHERQREELLRDIATSNVAHAYLFSGQAHLGKMTMARWFAWQILSQSLSPEENARVRVQVEGLLHPDLLVLDQLWIEELQEDWAMIAQTSNVSQGHRAKKGVKTNTISIDDIRILQERLLETGVGYWRCCIIRSVERMTDEAANAFLKILEEPPQGLIFILTTEKQSSLLPTVVSRTRLISFASLSRKELLPLLEGCPEEDWQFILHLSQGAPGAARLLMSDPDLLRTHKLIHAKAVAFWGAPTLRERLQLLVTLHERGQEAEDVLLHLALALREQSEASRSRNAAALHRLVRDLHTNAHRQLITQKFALAVR